MTQLCNLMWNVLFSSLPPYRKVLTGCNGFGFRTINHLLYKCSEETWRKWGGTFSSLMGLIFLKESVTEKKNTVKDISWQRQISCSVPNWEEAFKHMLKSHWGRASTKLMLSWLNTEFKQLFTHCIVKFVERDIASFIKPAFCKAHQHVLCLIKILLESVDN